MVLSLFRRDKKPDESQPKQDSKQDNKQTSSGTRAPKPAPSRARIGYFEDLTVKPLVAGIEGHVRSGQLRRGSIDELRELLANEELEVALLPTWDFLQIPNLNLVPGACISTYGAANMFLLCSKVLPTEIRRVLVDNESFGARSLAHIFLPSQLGSRPEFVRSQVPLNPRTFNFESSPYEAFLVVGDDALLVNRAEFTWVWDLSAAWAKANDTPFVMHVWACRRGLNLRAVPDELAKAAGANLNDLRQLVEKEAERLNVDRKGMDLILRHALRATYGPTELTAIRRFVKELTNAQLIPAGTQFSVYRSPAATRVPGL